MQNLFCGSLYLVLAVLAFPVQASDALVLPYSDADTELDDFIVRYDMQRQGQDWAKAMASLQGVKHQGQLAYRHAIRMDFKSESVLDESFFNAQDMRLLTKLIQGGLGENLSWKLYTQKGDRILGSQIYADQRETNSFQHQLSSPEYASDNFLLAQAPLAMYQSWTLNTSDGEQAHRWLMKVVKQETIHVPAGEFETWVVDKYLDGEEQPFIRLWISEQAPYLIRQEAEQVGIVWALEQVLYQE